MRNPQVNPDYTSFARPGQWQRQEGKAPPAQGLGPENPFDSSG